MNTQPIGLVGTAAVQTNIQVPEKVKYVLYARKSTESDEKQALSIDSQVKEMTAKIVEEAETTITISINVAINGETPLFSFLMSMSP